MDLDNINDIEILKKYLKRNMVQVKKDCAFQVVNYEIGEERILYLKKDYWYNIEQTENSIFVFLDNNFRMPIEFSYEEADEYLKRR